MTAYLYRCVWHHAVFEVLIRDRLLLEYARVTSLDRAAMDYVG